MHNVRTLSQLNPFTLLLYFVAVLGFAMFDGSPVTALTALITGIAFNYLLSVQRTKKSTSWIYVVMFLAVAVTNPLFSHRGVTPLFYINNAPITLEAFAYGLYLAEMITSVMLWFSCLTKLMSSDKLMYCFGKHLPKTALIISMSLRFIPMFVDKYHRVSKAQKATGLYSCQSYADRAKEHCRAFSVVVSWTLEHSVEVSMSMNARGYGCGKRTAFSLFQYKFRDLIFTLATVLATGLTLLSQLSVDKFFFYPEIKIPAFDITFAIKTTAYFVLTLVPIIVSITERIKWKYCISRI